jgi:hypothetical protein
MIGEKFRGSGRFGGNDCAMIIDEQIYGLFGMLVLSSFFSQAGIASRGMLRAGLDDFIAAVDEMRYESAFNMALLQYSTYICPTVSEALRY